MSDFDYDYIVIGSGFGGAVSAMRLAEKGYSVLVLESGKQYGSQDFAKTNWDLKRFLYLPRFGLRGIMRMDFFQGLMVLSGAGVGGGSLVYANTLIEPSEEAFASATWPKQVGVADWGDELDEFYAEAKRMLGVTRAPHDFPADRLLHKTATNLGYGSSFHPVNVGVYFGEPGKTVADPYFGGEGPARAGCTLCGGCMVGCRGNAKNTLDKNYLHFAEKYGAKIESESEVRGIFPESGGYRLSVERPGFIARRKKQLTGKQIVIAAGVLGTLKLLLRCRDELKSMPDLSKALATQVRTNSESIIGVRRRKTKEDYSQGLAIASGVNPNAHTKIEAVRYPHGSDAIALMSLPLVEGHSIASRLVQLLLCWLREPINYWKRSFPIGFAKETVILLVMQSLDNKLNFRWRRRFITLFRKTLKADYSQYGRPPVHIPEANVFAKEMAKEMGGEAGGSISDVLGMSVTAHVLGGCPMGQSAEDAVIAQDHSVFGYPGLFVVGGAAVPANLGVNPSLTITAMAERAMSKIPEKAAASIDQVA